MPMTMPGTITTMGYDALLRPTRIKSQAINALNAGGQVTTIGTNQAPVGNVLMDYRYTFNEVGNIGKRQTEHGDYQYAYDDLDRLTQAIPPGNTTLPTNPNQPNYTALPNEVYSYDGVHNRKTSTHQPGTWTYNANNQLTQWGDPAGSNANQPKVTQTFDENGHLKTKTVLPENQNDPENANRQIGYNTAERMNSVKDGSGNEIAKYAYDPFGRRIRKIATIGEQAGTTTFIYGANGLIAEADQTGNITTTYGWLPNGAWGTSPLFKVDVQAANSSTIHFYHNDHLGTSQRLTNAAGQVTWEARMEAFGKTTNLLTTLGSTTTNRMRFPGQYEDQETGAYYNYFRDYDSSNGRYVQSDPIGLKGGVNTYGYVSGSPLTDTDPTGLAACTVSFPDYPIDTGFGFSSTYMGGHEGVISYDSQGATRYYEFGRYSPSNEYVIGERRPAEEGNVRCVPIPDLVIDPKTGKPTPASLEALKKALSDKVGKKTKTVLTCDKDADEKKVNKYAQDFAANKKRPSYSWQPWSSNQCRDFASRAAGAGR